MIDPGVLRRNLVVLARDFFTSLGWLYKAPLSEIGELLKIHEEQGAEA